jgi:hypothetical protein
VRRRRRDENEATNIVSLLTLIEKDHRLFAEILIMQSLRSRHGAVTFRQKITTEEMDRIRVKAREKIDEVLNVFRQLPRSLILVFRYLEPSFKCCLA